VWTPSADRWLTDRATGARVGQERLQLPVNHLNAESVDRANDGGA